MVLDHPETRLARFVLRPNRSLTWREAGFVYAGIVAVSLTIGMVFYTAGLTLILPFSGLEMLVLGAAFYICLARSEMREVVSVSPDRVTVEKGRKGPEQRHEFPRSWVKVILERSGRTLHPSRLKLRSHGLEIEIGAFLTDGEREALAQQLVQAIHGTSPLEADRKKERPPVGGGVD